MKRLTAEKLVKMGACSRGVAEFRRRWPHGMTLTRKNIRGEWELDGFDAYCVTYWLLGGRVSKRVLHAFAPAAADICYEAIRKGQIRKRYRDLFV